MKTKAISFAVIAATTAFGASAQWSLDSCINYAHEHNIDIKLSQVERLNAEYGVTEAKDGFLPTVSAGASQNFGFGRGLTSENIYANRNTQNFSWSVGMDMPLFQGLSNVRRLDYAMANLRTMVSRVEAAKDDVTLNVISQYLQVLYCREVLKTADNQVTVSGDELQRRRVLAENGKIAELDVVQAESQLASDRLTQVNAANDYTLALVDLAQMLRLPDTDGFSVCEIDTVPQALPSVDEVFTNALGSNNAMQAARLEVEAAGKNIALARSGYMPRLSLNAGLNSSYYKVSGLENMSFGKQMRENFSKYIGLTLTIPIFDAFSTRNSERRARAARTTASLQLDNQRNALYHNIQTAYHQAVAARHKAAASAVAADAAEASFRAVSDKYEFGRATPTEYDEAKSILFRTRVNLIQARYESVLRARILAFYNKTAEVTN